MDKQKLLSHLQGEQEQAVGIAVLEAARLAWETNRPQVTGFFDPYEQRVAKSVLSGIPEVAHLTFGGYRQAERARVVVYPQFYLTETIESPVRVLDVAGSFGFVDVKHGDFLGAVLGTGLKREMIGDVIITERGCQVVVAEEVTDYLQQNLERVHEVPVTVVEIDEEQISVEPERVKEIKTTVASMRLDAIAASGFGTSRTRMAREIKSERVKVNWKVVSNPSQEIAAGDVVSIRGRGRVIVAEVRGETRKGRTSLLLQRLL